jgi:hypothetical protein
MPRKKYVELMELFWNEFAEMEMKPRKWKCNA